MNRRILSNIKDHTAPTDKLPVQYLITASIEEVEDVEILLLSLWNRKDSKFTSKDKAAFKVFIWGRSYLSQKLQNDGTYKWSKACIANLINWWRWEDRLLAACCTLEEREIIAGYLECKCPKPGEELKVIDDFQQDIMMERLATKHDKIKRKIDEAMEKVPDLPKDFEKWIYNDPLGFSRYIYYQRQGRRINAFCSECKKEFTITETQGTKRTVKHNNSGTCPQCNKKIVYKAKGKSKNVHDTAKFAIMQRYEDGFVVRYFHGSKSYLKNYRNPELNYWEGIREIFYLEGGLLKKERYEHAAFCQTGEYRWCNDSGKIDTPKAYFYTRNLKRLLQGTKWEYSCMYEFAKEVKFLYADTFLEEYLKHPEIEYLIKFKLYWFLNEKLSTFYHPDWSDINFKGKNIQEIFGVDKQLFLQMQRLNLGREGLHLIKYAAAIRNKVNALTDQQVKWILSNVEPSNFCTMLKYSTPHKIIKYLKKQSNKEYELRNVLFDWCDYIRQCKELKFDLNNTFILYPKNLKEKHEEHTIMCEAKGLEKYEENIKKVYTSLDEAYSFQDKNYLIRPAQNVSEIVKEGHKLRHCVAGVNYVNGMAKGTKAIMFLRKAEEPDKPFYTVELSLKELRVVQCRGYKNCDQTEDTRKFLEKWKSKKLMTNGIKKAI